MLTLDWTGDPLTPFEPALPIDGPVQVERLDPSEVGLHTIPVLPLGYTAAAETTTRTNRMAKTRLLRFCLLMEAPFF